MAPGERPSEKPRGFYALKDSWAKDKFRGNFLGTWHNVYFPLIKTGLLFAEYFAVSTICSCWIVPLVTCLLTLLFYQDIMCLFHSNTIKVGAMDH